MKKLGAILAFSTLVVVGAGLIVGDTIVAKNFGVISDVLGGNTANFEGSDVENAAKVGDELCQEIEEQGIVLLKNDTIAGGNKSLPLASSLKKVNVFGYASVNFLQKGVGSGSSSINQEKSINFLQALENYGIEYNTEITNGYININNFKSNGALIDITKKNDSKDYILYQPTVEWHQNYITNAKVFSDTAIMVIHRVGGENIGEIPTTQTLTTESNVGETDSTRTYLNTTKYEEGLIDLLAANFSNVILVVNNTNPMHLTCLKGDKINSCINVGITGQSGANAIPYILWGEKKVGNDTIKVSPSGKLTDTYSYAANTSPSYANRAKASNHIQYLEDIYYGYKWYETADAEGYWDSISNTYGTKYNGVVQFPFGYGLSYSNFEWALSDTPTVTNLSSGKITANSEVTFKVKVTNKGTYPARDVVELYVSPSYKSGGIEKSSILLMDFAKTSVLQPNDSETVTLNFKVYDFASYDCYDKNSNGFKGYEIDYGKDGNYVVSFRSDVHTLKSMSNGTLTLAVPTAGIKYENDPVTGVKVENRMTGSNAYASTPIDGSNVNASQKYLSRSNFATLFPTSHAATPSGTNNAENYTCTQFDSLPMTNANPVDSGLRIITLEDGSFATSEQLSGKSGATLKANEALIADLANYDSPSWNTLLDQISISDLTAIIENGGFKTYPITSIGKPRAYDTDGPAGFNKNTMSIGDGDPAKWTAYPSETVIGQTWSKELAEKMGLAMGLEGQATGVQGWYAPGVNIHRTPYTARNYEYYSEDSVLSGVLAAKVIEGAKINGLYCYLKHFVLSEPGPNPSNLNTWCTEQNLRENYLRPFEIAVKTGGANAIMSAFNRVGSVWAGASYPCLTQILRNEWGFRGSVITDYAGTNNTSKGKMNPTQGVKAGNDLWLNPNDGAISNPISKTEASSVNAARNSAKNILYTYVDTYNYGKNHLSPYEGYNAIVGVSVLKAPNNWWLPVLIVVEALIIIGLLVWSAFGVKGLVAIHKAKVNGNELASGAPAGEKKTKHTKNENSKEVISESIAPTQTQVSEKVKKPFYLSTRNLQIITLVLGILLFVGLLLAIVIPLCTKIL